MTAARRAGRSTCSPCHLDFGGGMLQGDRGWLGDLYELSGKRVTTGTPDLASLLAAFRAYNDPVRKKAFFLLLP